jgi:hypothetical protein
LLTSPKLSLKCELGVEAFVAYNGQGTPHFRVFDWARYPAAPWQTDIPFTSLTNYLTTASAHGHPYPVLPVWNSTFLIGANMYRNQALLYNHVRGGWDLIYQYDYTGTTMGIGAAGRQLLRRTPISVPIMKASIWCSSILTMLSPSAADPAACRRGEGYHAVQLSAGAAYDDRAAGQTFQRANC